MNADYLQQFCFDTDDVRHHIRKPWSRGDRTYATNGHILVHVPRLADVAENDRAPQAVSNLLERAKTGTWLPVPVTTMPPYIPCTWCDGSGKDPSDRRYRCDECGGKKSEPDYRTGTIIGPAKFANRYLALIQGWKIAPTDKSSAAKIKFVDAEGLLMPMRME